MTDEIKKTGRPKEYKSEYVSMVYEYLASCKDEEVKRVVTDGEKSTSYQYRVKVNLPTIEGLALFLHVSKDTIYEWEKESIDTLFSDALVKLRQEQAVKLINGGLSGDYTSKIATVLLNQHGYREQTAQEITGKDGKDLIPHPILGNVRKDNGNQESNTAEKKN